MGGPGLSLVKYVEFQIRWKHARSSLISSLIKSRKEEGLELTEQYGPSCWKRRKKWGHGLYHALTLRSRCRGAQAKQYGTVQRLSLTSQVIEIKAILFNTNLREVFIIKMLHNTQLIYNEVHII